MKRPLVILTLIFCSGIFFVSLVRVSFLLIYGLALIFFLFVFLSLKKAARFDIFVCCAIFFFGAGLCKNSFILPGRHVARCIPYKNNSLALRGTIDSQPSFRNNLVSFIFKAREIQSGDAKYSTCGNVLVYIRCPKDLSFACGRLEDLDYGQELILKGNLSRPYRFTGSFRQSFRDYLYNQNIFCVMNVKTPWSVINLRQDRGFALKRFALRMKRGMEDVIAKRASSVPAAILEAMILGEKRNIPALINNSMMKSGTVHILVVSGFNVALVVFIIVLFLKLARIPKAARFFIAAPLIILYCLMTGSSTPVVRATIMAIVIIFSYSLRRQADIYNSCALAALFILMINPRQLFDIGFQLSFLSVISIACAYPRLKSFLPEKFVRIKYIAFLTDGCLVSFAAWFGTAGLIAYYFRMVSPITVLANIFIVPLASLITLCGFSLIIMEFVCPPIAPFFACSCEFAVSLLLNINALLIKLPCAYFYLS